MASDAWRRSDGWIAPRSSGTRTAAGIDVAIVDSGIDAEHPALAGRPIRRLRVEFDGDDTSIVEDPAATDLVGHGTACAGIVAGIAPAADLISIRVLGPDNRGKGRAVAAADRLGDRAGRGGRESEPLVAQRSDVRRVPRSRRPRLLRQHAPGLCGEQRPGAVVSLPVRRRRCPWPLTTCPIRMSGSTTPTPPVEFGAYGVDVDVAWRDGGRIRATGNSFAAPHLAGQAARLRSRHPAASPFEIKALLAATADQPA